MTRTREEIEILRELGYDPDDPAYSVQMMDDNAGIPVVTATETIEIENVEYDANEVKLALEMAIDALQRVLKFMK